MQIDGKTYNLSFELTDLAEAEKLFRSQGHSCEPSRRLA